MAVLLGATACGATSDPRSGLPRTPSTPGSLAPATTTLTTTTTIIEAGQTSSGYIADEQFWAPEPTWEPDYEDVDPPEPEESMDTDACLLWC